MKYSIIFICAAFSFSCVTAQSSDASGGSAGTFAEFETVLFYALELADAACPQTYADAMCYVHGYDDFFAFKNAFTGNFLSALEEVERWRYTEIEVQGETAQVFRATYRISATSDTFTLTYLPENRLFLER